MSKNVPEVNIPERKKNFVSKLSDYPEDQPVSSPMSSEEGLNLRRAQGTNSTKVKRNAVKFRPAIDIRNVK